MAFDSVVTNPGRLRILAALAREPRQAFVALRNQTGLTDGNLATHARRLQAAGLIAIEKSITAGKPLTTLNLTREGRDALTQHAQDLQTALFGSSTDVSIAEMSAPAGVDDRPLSVSAVSGGSSDDDWVD